jgi:dTDP-glucose 4,6-dehydratase
MAFPYTTILVTGGAGFIGSCFIRYMLARYAEVRVVNLDALTYAGNPRNVLSVADDPRYQFVHGDITRAHDVCSAFQRAEAAFGAPVTAVVHFAAETHVDRSIDDPARFLTTNVLGTEIMLRIARVEQVRRFVHISTDEVYGTLAPLADPFRESSPIAPNNPYAASKAASDLIARAYYATFGLPVIISRCSNNYGPYQFSEKLIPLMIAHALKNQPLPVYGDGRQVRDWIYVEDHVAGIVAVLEHGTPGEVYNLGGNTEVENREVVNTILAVLGKPESLIRFVPDRPGHDRRYAMNTDKARRELGWSPTVTFAEGLPRTVQWYVDHRDWEQSAQIGHADNQEAHGSDSKDP